MKKTKVKVLSGFRVTIPAEARRRLLIKTDEELELAVKGNCLIYKVGSLPEDPVFTMLGLNRGPQKKLSQAEQGVADELEKKVDRSLKSSSQKRRH
jgi:bifunctional DNA-binding transcriptional regulator/antitoxin component of YhaV-PrlF toxin-antitoxin module